MNWKKTKLIRIIVPIALLLALNSFDLIGEPVNNLNVKLMSKKTENSVFYKNADFFFKKHVKNGRVAYDSIIANPESLNQLINQIKNYTVSKADTADYQAFYINAYNLCVIKGLVNNLPLVSPLSTKGFFDKITCNVAGSEITLNHLENGILRTEFNEPRFHFVLVCGAIGCPPLISEAYKPEKLESQLLRQTKLALNGTYFITVNNKKKKVIGSEILNWYKSDFTSENQTEIDFINLYRDEKIPTNYKLEYSTYNWAINKQ